MNYLIKYYVESSIGALLKEGQIRIKNVQSENHALDALTKRLKANYPFRVNVFVQDIIREPESQLDDIFNIFGDIFKQTKK